MAPRRRRGGKTKAAESPARKPRTRARPTSKPLTPVAREERVDDVSPVQGKRRRSTPKACPCCSFSSPHPTGSMDADTTVFTVPMPKRSSDSSTRRPRASTISSRSSSNVLDGNGSVFTVPMPKRRNSTFLMRLAEEHKARTIHAKKFDRFIRQGLSYYLAKLLVNKFIRDGRLEQTDATGTEGRGDDLLDSD